MEWSDQEHEGGLKRDVCVSDLELGTLGSLRFPVELVCFREHVSALQTANDEVCGFCQLSSTPVDPHQHTLHLPSVHIPTKTPSHSRLHIIQSAIVAKEYALSCVGLSMRSISAKP